MSMVGDGPYYMSKLGTLLVTYSLRKMVPFLPSPSRADRLP